MPDLLIYSRGGKTVYKRGHIVEVHRYDCIEPVGKNSQCVILRIPAEYEKIEFLSNPTMKSPWGWTKEKWRLDWGSIPKKAKRQLMKTGRAEIEDYSGLRFRAKGIKNGRKLQ